MRPPKGGTLQSVRCRNLALIFTGEDTGTKLSIPFAANWLVNGKLKVKDIPVLASHCPFCGKLL